MPMTLGNFPALVDKTIAAVLFNQFMLEPSMVPLLLDMLTSDSAEEKFSEVGGLGDFEKYADSGQVQSLTKDSPFEGYTKTFTHDEFTKSIDIQRKLIDDQKLYQIADIAKGTGIAAARTREKDAAKVFNNAFTTTLVADGLSLCNNAHTSKAVSATFDNRRTEVLNGINLSIVKQVMLRDFRDDRNERYNVQPNTLLVPLELDETAYEIVKSSGQVNTANNNANVHQGRYTQIVWNYLTSATSWFLMDMSQWKRSAKWFDRVPLEVVDSGTHNNLFRTLSAYMRYSVGVRDWRGIMGSDGTV